MGAMQDRRRLWFVTQDIMRSSHHPFSHFSCANITTLESLDQDSIREWYNAEYDPRGMHLFVEGYEPLEELEQCVKDRFGGIKFSPKWKGPVRAEPYGNIIPPSVPGSWVYVEPIKDIRILKLAWQIPSKFSIEGNRAAGVAAQELRRMG